MNIELALKRQELVDSINRLGRKPEAHPAMLSPPEAALQRRRQALVRKLEQFDSEHPEIVAALQP
jgi:hypothetical protein